MGRQFLTALLLFISGSAFAQVNYVLNPDFELHTFCPNSNDQISAATYWSGVDSIGFNTCVPDYCHSCVPYGLINNVPYCYYYWQYAHSGNGMAKVQMYYDEYEPAYPIYRDYLQGRLYKNLVPGKSYCVSFYVCLAEYSRYAIKDIGVYFDNGSIDTTGNCGHPQTQYTPQVTNANGIISDTMSWTKIEGTFIADSMESFITIGNFRDSSHTTLLQMPLNFYSKDDAYYSIYLLST